ncbi:Tripartite tricarboxylate transporter TctA family protein [Amphibacillus marinus]|uniref:Tripartite tricarboxylate transporter TctA family protein n=1 Tax=Amphibacillus marinus TaxID=872970 RepID=A0A1H8K4E2_9BACI|nr:tripartite tricarboxylate transporter permease [Amphibacillus marinus]SEN87870.1 Tripartite tricarboxylate transporter TctA family protein [Amphibacillus marinus]
MDFVLISQMVAAAVAATLLYTLIGIAPGTDETAVLAPVTLVLVLTGLEPIVILSFFIAAIVAKKLTDSIPVAVAGIPGGVMAAPMVEHALVLKEHGRPELAIRKMVSGSVIGTMVAIPVSFLFARILAPYSEVVGSYANQLFLFGAILLALMSKQRWIALASIVPFAILIQGLRHLYWGVGIVPQGTNVFVSFFLGITIGPVVMTLFELLNGKVREKLPRYDKKLITTDRNNQYQGIPNPFKILTTQELSLSAVTSFLGSLLFFMSPVGITILLGEFVSGFVKDPVKKSSLAISSMDGLTNAAYLSGTLIPLVALGLPLSPVAIGPANALFNAPPVFTEDYNLHHILSTYEFVWATLIGAAVAILLTYFVIVKYAEQICIFVFKKVPHEAMIGLFFGLVVLLAYMDAGWINIAGVMLIALVAGFLHRLGVNYGVQFMVLYAAPYIIQLLTR